MWLLQREEHQCSCWLKLHCKQILLYFKHILLYFLLASAVHLIQLPMVLLGGQPRSWGMDLGLCPMCLDDLWVSMQRISAKPFFFFTVYSLTSSRVFIMSSSLASNSGAPLTSQQCLCPSFLSELTLFLSSTSNIFVV